MEKHLQKPQWTGEFFVPGSSPARIRNDHLSRYQFAKGFVHGRKVLDIACGVGYGSVMLRETASQVFGVDISEENILYASEQYQYENLKFEKGDIRTYGIGRNLYFDLVVCFETIEHVPEYQLALSNISSLLSPGGKLLISSPNRTVTSPKAKLITDLPNNPFHSQEFTIRELVETLQNIGFDITDQDIYGQRQRIVFPNRGINFLIKRFLRPDFYSSPAVKPIGWLKSPRYFVLVCTKPSF